MYGAKIKHALCDLIREVYLIMLKLLIVDHPKSIPRPVVLNIYLYANFLLT